MILFLHGPNTFRSRGHLHRIINKFRIDRDPQGLNIVVLDAQKETSGTLLEQIFAAPFLAEKRMVVIENLLLSKHTEAQQEIMTRMEEHTLPVSTVLVLWEGKEKTKTKDGKLFFDRLLKEKYAQQFEILTGAKLNGWIAAEMKERGWDIDQDAAAYLTKHIGTDMWRLNSVLEQTMGYAMSREEKKITKSDVAIFVGEKADENIFTLVDAIVARQPKQVFAMVNEQYAQGKETQYLFAMVLRQFRILLEMRDVFERDDTLNSETLAKQLGLHPFVVKKSLPLVKRYTMRELKDTYTGLLALDVAIKTGRGDARVLFDMFVGRVCLTE